MGFHEGRHLPDHGEGGTGFDRGRELARADEIFLTSTAGGIMPVTLLDGQAVGEGKPGPITRRLHDVYWRRQEEGWLCRTIAYES